MFHGKRIEWTAEAIVGWSKLEQIRAIVLNAIPIALKEHSKAIISAVTWSLSLLTVLTILTREFRYHASYKLYATVECIEIRWILIEGVL